MANPVIHFEVQADDVARAKKFYETVLDMKLERHAMGPLDMAWFPWVDKSNGAGGALVKHEAYQPAADGGVLIYFTAFSGDLSNELGRVEVAGGKICQGKKMISPEYGYMAVVSDTEGNRLALHSRA